MVRDYQKLTPDRNWNEIGMWMILKNQWLVKTILRRSMGERIYDLPWKKGILSPTPSPPSREISHFLPSLLSRLSLSSSK